jgi:hypothetical protein
MRAATPGSLLQYVGDSAHSMHPLQYGLLAHAEFCLPQHSPPLAAWVGAADRRSAID